MKSDVERLLVFNSHEGWISLLEGCGYELDIVVGLPGRLVRGWDQRQRPIPRGARLIPLERLGAEPIEAVGAVCSNISDLLTLKDAAIPKLLVLHKSLASSHDEQGAELEPATLRKALARYLELTAAHAVAVTPWKASTWEVTNEVLLPGLEVEDYLPWTGVEAAGIRVSHQMDQRARTLLVDLHDQAFSGLPIQLVGVNPKRPGSVPSRDHEHLKWMLSRHRFLVHTADPALEDGFNLAMLEGMAAGLPVIGNRHPTSPITHGVDGFLSNDPAELRGFAETLIADRHLAERMGEAARETVRARFPRERFHEEFRAAVLWSRALHEERGRQVAAQRKAMVSAAPR